MYKHYTVGNEIFKIIVEIINDKTWELDLNYLYACIIFILYNGDIHWYNNYVDVNI